MCGIYGFVGKIKKGKHKRVLKLMKALAIESQERGIDATGYFSVSKDKVIMEKDAVDADEFVVADNQFVNSILDNDPHIWVGHNREASVGDLDSKSAHPFIGEKYIMVHNGTCRAVFEMIDKKIADKLVSGSDSEVILNLIERDGKIETFKNISAYSLVLFDIETDDLWFARDPKRPMVVYDLRKLYGIRVFCSTKDIGDRSLELMGIKNNYPCFSTKSFHLYHADYRDGEFTNKGKYYQPPPPPEPPPEPPSEPPKRKSMGRRIYEKYFKIPSRKENEESKERSSRIQNAMAVYGD